ncbi:hypothetical protein Plhal304r1_c079g0165421 [Plasmopara halstedii]
MTVPLRLTSLLAFSVTSFLGHCSFSSLLNTRNMVCFLAIAFIVYSFHGIQAQEVETPIVETLQDNIVPETIAPVETTAPVDTTAPPVTETPPPIVTRVSPIVTEEVTTPPPVPTEAPTLSVTTEAPPSLLPESTSSTTTEPVAVTTPPVVDENVPADTEAPTTMPPTIMPSTGQNVSEGLNTTKSADTIVPPVTFRDIETDNSEASLHGSEAFDHPTTPSPSRSSSFEDIPKETSSTFPGIPFSKTLIISALGGVGLFVILLLLCVKCRASKRQVPDLNTPVQATNTFSRTSSSPSSSVWKSTRSTFASRDLPFASSLRAKLNATSRSSIDYDRPNPISFIASLPPNNSAIFLRESNTSDQSLSLRGCSEFSVHHQHDSDVSGRYSTSDRYSTKERYSTTSRLSSEPERSNSGRVPSLLSKGTDVSRISSTSSTLSSATTRRHNRMSLATPDLSQSLPSDTTSGTNTRTDVRDWYRVIESPADNDRYTSTSLVSDHTTNEQDSFEL